MIATYQRPRRRAAVIHSLVAIVRLAVQGSAENRSVRRENSTTVARARLNLIATTSGPTEKWKHVRAPCERRTDRRETTGDTLGDDQTETELVLSSAAMIVPLSLTTTDCNGCAQSLTPTALQAANAPLPCCDARLAPL